MCPNGCAVYFCSERFVGGVVKVQTANQIFAVLSKGIVLGNSGESLAQHKLIAVADLMLPFMSVFHFFTPFLFLSGIKKLLYPDMVIVQKKA